LTALPSPSELCLRHHGGMESRHVSIWIAAAPDAVYAFASDPLEMSRWAAGLAQGALRRAVDGWVADSPMGEVTVEFAAANAFGVLDHVVRLPSGEANYNPMRVVPGNADGPGAAQSEVVFSVRRRPGMTDDEFDADVAAVTADLETLREIIEGAN
jgi:hypothetical protein